MKIIKAIILITLIKAQNAYKNINDTKAWGFVNKKQNCFRTFSLVFQWHPELKIGVGYTCTALNPVKEHLKQTIIFSS